MLRLSAAAIALAASLAGCPPPEGRFVCASHADCPAGWTCRADRRCWSAPADSASLDGGPTDPADASADAAGS
jgi:hypothetical protein